MNRHLAGIVSVGLLALAACGGGGSTPKPPTYQLSGAITRAWGGPLAGVAVDLGGAAGGTAMTDAGGRFTFPSVSDGTYTLTPRLAGWVFAPPAPSVVVSGADRTQDFTADGAYGIGGVVSGAVTGGVTIALSGGGVVKPAATTAAGTGAYLFTGLPNGTYTLTPTLAGHTFTPAAPVVVVDGAGATQDFVAAAALRIAGTLRFGPDPLPGATVRLTGARTALATTDAAGAYAFEALAQGQTYVVTPATFGFQTDPATRTYTLAGSVTDADFAADAAGPATKTLHGTLSYAGTRTGPIYVTVSASQFTDASPTGGTGLTAQPGAWSGRAFTVRNVQAMGFVSVRAWMDTLGVGRFVAGADPSVSFDFDTASGATDLGDHALLDPAAPAVTSGIAVSQVVAGDGTAVVIFDPPRAAASALLADGFRVYWNTSATVDAAHTLGTVTLKATSDFAVVHGLANGTPYWFAVEARVGGAPLPGQLASTTAPVTPAPSAGTAIISGTVGHPAAAAPSALYVVAQSGGKGPAGIWWQRIANPSGTQSAYALRAPPGTYVIFAFLDRGDDGAVGIGEPARFPDQLTSFITAVAGANAGPTISLAAGNATPSLATARFATAFGGGAFFDLAVASAAKLPLSAAVTGPGLRGPLDLGLQADAGGIGATLAVSFDPAPIFPFTGDAYTMEVTYADGSTETFQRPVTGSFGGPPGVIAPADLATGVATVPTFQWSAPPGASGSYGWVLELSAQAGDQQVWGTFLPGTETSVAYDADGLALTPELTPFTGYAWNIIAIDADGNRAGYGATFATGASVLQVYDLLAGPTLDGQRWQTPQLSRAVVGGRAVLGVRADGMQARAVQGATYNNALGVLAGDRRVTTLGATVTVPAASASRTGEALLMGGVRLVYQPAADRGLPFPFGSLNSLIAALELFDDGSGPRLRRRFYHCNDGGCATFGGAGIAAVDPPGFTVQGVSAHAPAAWDVPYALELSLDEASGVFTWTVQGGAFAAPVSGTADASAWAASVGMALGTTSNGFRDALLYSRVSDDAGGSSGGIAPEFDDVRVGFDGAAAAAFDGFGAGFLDPSRWGASDSDVWLAGGSLHLSSALTTVTAGGGTETTTVNVMYPGSFRAWQADVAIVAEEPGPTLDPGGWAGMTGAFYNDGTAGTGAAGDVRAGITVGTGSASWSVRRCDDATCDSATSVGGTLIPSPGHPLGVGTVHTLFVRWDPVARLVTFGLDDATPVQVDPTTVLPAAPAVNPVPRHPLHALTSSAFVGGAAPAGSTARVEAAFSNVRGSPP